LILSGDPAIMTVKLVQTVFHLFFKEKAATETTVLLPQIFSLLICSIPKIWIQASPGSWLVGM
jgi:hypothetical protein